MQDRNLQTLTSVALEQPDGKTALTHLTKRLGEMGWDKKGEGEGIYDVPDRHLICKRVSNCHQVQVRTLVLHKGSTTVNATFT